MSKFNLTIEQEGDSFTATLEGPGDKGNTVSARSPSNATPERAARRVVFLFSLMNPLFGTNCQSVADR